MITELSYIALTEVHYTDMLVDLADIDIFDSRVMSKFGGQRADIAIYQSERPSAVIELKIIDEGRSLSGLVEDRNKIQRLRDFVEQAGKAVPDGYIGALVFDTYVGSTVKSAAETIGSIQRALGAAPPHSSKMTDARGNGWKWQFVCFNVA